MTHDLKRFVSAATCCLIVVNAVAHPTSQGHPGTIGASAPGRPADDRASAPWSGRLVDAVAWLEYGDRQPQSVFTFERLSAIFADQRAIERFVEAATSAEALIRRSNEALRQAHLDAEINNRLVDLAEAQRVFDELAAEYERLRKKATAGEDAGLFGLLFELAGNVVGTAILGPLFGSAIGAGLHRALDGGSFQEVLFTMGLHAGAAEMAQQLGAAMLDPNASPKRLALAEAGLAAADGAIIAFDIVPAGFASGGDIPMYRGAIHVDDAVRPRVPEQHVGTGPSHTFPVLMSVSDRHPEPLLAPWVEAVVASAVDRATAALSRSPRGSLAAAAADARWRGKDPGMRVLTGDLLFRVRQLLRVGVERPVELARVARERQSRARSGREQLIQEIELNHIDVAVEDQERETEKLRAHYQAVWAEYNNRRSGFLGAVAGLIVGFAGSMVGGPLLGAALAGGIGTAINGGGFGAVTLSAGMSTGRFYVARRAAAKLAADQIPSEPPTEAPPSSLEQAFPTPPSGPGRDLEYVRAYEAHAASGGDIEKLPSAYNDAYIYAYVRLSPEEKVAYLETVADIASLGLSAKDFKDDPSLTNGLFLAADGAAVLTPLPSTGTVKATAKAGSKVFRVIGGKAKEVGQFWTPLDPFSGAAGHMKVRFPEYADGIKSKLGLPKENSVTSVVTATTTKDLPLGTAKGLGDMPGGAPEIVLDPKALMNRSEPVPVLPYGEGNLPNLRP